MQNLKKVLVSPVSIGVMCLLIIGSIFGFNYYEKQTYFSSLEPIMLSHDTLIKDYRKTIESNGVSWGDYFAKMEKFVDEIEDIRDKLISLKTPKSRQEQHKKLIELVCLERDIIEKRLSFSKFIFQADVSIKNAERWKDYAQKYGDYKELGKAIEEVKSANSSSERVIEELKIMQKEYLELYFKLKPIYKISPIVE